MNKSEVYFEALEAESRKDCDICGRGRKTLFSLQKSKRQPSNVLRTLLLVGTTILAPLSFAQTANAQQSIDDTSHTANSCATLGGTLVGGNLYTDFNNGTFGTISGGVKSPASSPYGLPQIDPIDYAQYIERVGNNDSNPPIHGEWTIVGDIDRARNKFQHEGNIQDPTDPNGMFFHMDPDETPQTFKSTLTGLIPGSSIEVSFWVADAEISLSSPKQTVGIKVDDVQVYNTGLISNITTGELVWYKHSMTVTVDADGELEIEVLPLDGGSKGRDIHFDSMNVQECSFATPSLSLMKEADNDSNREPGETITYTYTVENTGDVNIEDITIDDQHTASSGTSSLPVAGEAGDAGNSLNSSDAIANDGSWDVLAPGDIVRFTSTYEVTDADAYSMADITNIATATGNPVSGSLVSPTSSESVSTVSFLASDSSLPQFSCTANFYEVIESRLNVLDVTNDPGVYVPIGSPATDRYNATGYNANDNYVYGITNGGLWGAEDKHLIRVGANGSTEVLVDLEAAVTATGGSAAQGIMVGNRLYFGTGQPNLGYVDVTTGVIGTQNFTGSLPSNLLVDYSHVVSGGQDYLIGIRNGIIYRFNLATSMVTSIPASVSGLPTTKAWGAAWSTSDGIVYFSENATGTIYIIDGALTSSPSVIGTVAATKSSAHDGMNCINGGNPFDGLPELTVTKTASALPETVLVGDTITYTFEVENTGSIAINDVVPVEAGVTVDGSAATGALSGLTIVTETGFISTDTDTDNKVDALEPGEIAKFEATYTFSQADIDAMFAASDPLTAIDNSATATGTPAIGALATVIPSVVETGVAPAPAMTLVKVADDNTDRKPGETINYTYTVENTGAVNITAVTISDQHTSAAGTVALDVGGETAAIGNSGSSTDAEQNGSWDVLAPGDSVTFTASYVVTEADVINGGDITNIATVTATPASGSFGADPITADEAVTVTPLEADLSITKTNTPGVNGEVDKADDTLTTGDNTTYTLVVTNNGPDSVAGALVTDSVVEGLTCTATDTVTITGDGVPSGSFTIGDLTGSGISLGALADGESATLTYSCLVD